MFSADVDAWLEDDTQDDAPRQCRTHYVRKASAPDWSRRLSRGDYTAVYPVEVQQFCDANKLGDYLRISIDLANRIFACGEDLCIRLDSDPETSDQWVVIEVVIKTDVADALKLESQYIDAFVTAVPWPERDQIRLACNLV